MISQNLTLLMAWFVETNAVNMGNHTTGVGQIIVAGHTIGIVANPEVC